jgi:hypothetical protein
MTKGDVPETMPRAISEIEAAYIAGFQNVRDFLRARQEGSFPEPDRIDPDRWSVERLRDWINGPTLAGRSVTADRASSVRAASAGRDHEDPSSWPIDLPEACARLKCSERWLRGHLAEHPGCHRRAGRRILFTRVDWVALLESLSRRATISSNLNRSAQAKGAGAQAGSVVPMSPGHMSRKLQALFPRPASHRETLSDGRKK